MPANLDSIKQAVNKMSDKLGEVDDAIQEARSFSEEEDGLDKIDDKLEPVWRLLSGIKKELNRK